MNLIEHAVEPQHVVVGQLDAARTQVGEERAEVIDAGAQSLQPRAMRGLEDRGEQGGATAGDRAHEAAERALGAERGDRVVLPAQTAQPALFVGEDRPQAEPAGQLDRLAREVAEERAGPLARREEVLGDAGVLEIADQVGCAESPDPEPCPEAVEPRVCRQIEAGREQAARVAVDQAQLCVGAGERRGAAQPSRLVRDRGPISQHRERVVFGLVERLEDLARSRLEPAQGGRALFEQSGLAREQRREIRRSEGARADRQRRAAATLVDDGERVAPRQKLDLAERTAQRRAPRDRGLAWRKAARRKRSPRAWPTNLSSTAA